MRRNVCVVRSWIVGIYYEISEKDENNNVITPAQTYETNCIIKGSPDKLIVVQGLNGYLSEIWKCCDRL
jgi:hypothetical protein